MLVCPVCPCIQSACVSRTPARCRDVTFSLSLAVLRPSSWSTTTRGLGAPSPPCTAARGRATGCRGSSDSGSTTRAASTCADPPSGSGRASAATPTTPVPAPSTSRTARSTATGGTARRTTRWRAARRTCRASRCPGPAPTRPRDTSTATSDVCPSTASRTDWSRGGRTTSLVSNGEALVSKGATTRATSLVSKGWATRATPLVSNEATRRRTALVSNGATTRATSLVNLTEFNWIATPSPNCVGNPGWHRTRKPLAYRVSCYTHSPQLNIPRSFKIVIYLILEHIYTSSINTFPWQSIPFIYRSLRKCILSYV